MNKTTDSDADKTNPQAHSGKDSWHSDTKWVENLRASVRPFLTYAFFGLFAIVKITALCQLLYQGESIADALDKVWDGETEALFAIVISYWFGQRTFSKSRSKKVITTEEKSDASKKEG